MTIDERIEALTMNLELMSHQIQDHSKQIQDHSKQIQEHSKQLAIDAEHIRALVRIAEIHEHRLSEGGL